MKKDLVLTNDGSYTLYSEQFDQNYHSQKEGALNESLSKHIIPAISYHKDKKELNILDICFGLGYNTLATIYYIEQNNLDIKLNIYSPEFDGDLIISLKDFNYPKEFEKYKDIITQLSTKLKYNSNNINIEIYQGDARKYLDILAPSNIDIVYQDAFSSDVNKALWTKEYFGQIKKLLKEDAIITTYSIATPIRLSIWENNISIYEYKPENSNRITIAINNTKIIKKENYKYIDMVLKQKRNTEARSLSDTTINSN